MLAAALTLPAAALALTFYPRPPAADPRAMVIAARTNIMREHLATKTGPFVILAGDSHAEVLNWDRICGLSVVNLGIGGMTARDYPEVLAQLESAARAEAAILFIGTNDLARGLEPERPDQAARFDEKFAETLDALGRLAKQRFHAPLTPPANDPRAAEALNMAAAPAYRQSARAICEAKGCTTMPVDGSGLQFRGDGIHVDRSDRTMGGNLHRLVEASVCGALAQPPKR